MTKIKKNWTKKTKIKNEQKKKLQRLKNTDNDWNMDENNGPKLKNEQKKGHKVKIDQKFFGDFYTFDFWSKHVAADLVTKYPDPLRNCGKNRLLYM